MAGQIAYLEHAQTPLFGARGDLGAAAARAQLAATCGSRVAFHRLILSLETGGGIASVGQVQLLTRVLLHDLSDHLQVELAWVAAVHMDTDNLHSHILLGGAARLRSTVRQIGVELHATEYALLRERGTHWAHKLARPGSTGRHALGHSIR
jgi:hypothetical protein